MSTSRLFSAVAVAAVLLGSCGGAGGTSGAADVGSIELQSIDGGPTSIDDIAADRPLLVSLWAVWCQPCKRELPELADIAADPEAPVDVLALNIGDDPDRISAFLDGLGLDIPVAIDRLGSVLDALDVASVPATIIVMPDGSVGWSHVGAVTRADIDAAMADLTASRS